jgi:small subunit ribosomal protein S21
MKGGNQLSEVIISDGESVERALRTFKKKVDRAGILKDLRKKRHFETPSEKRKRKLATARRGRR